MSLSQKYYGRALIEAKKMRFQETTVSLLPLAVVKKVAEQVAKAKRVHLFVDQEVTLRRGSYFVLTSQCGIVDVTICRDPNGKVSHYFLSSGSTCESVQFEKKVVLALIKAGHLKVPVVEFSEGLVELPVPPWVELGYCQNEPSDGNSGSTKLCFESEAREIVEKWVKSLKKKGG